MHRHPRGYPASSCAPLIRPARRGPTTHLARRRACAGTLRACVDGASDGDHREIASNAPSPRDISLYSRSLSLVAAAGYAPNFAANHWLQRDHLSHCRQRGGNAAWTRLRRRLRLHHLQRHRHRQRRRQRSAPRAQRLGHQQLPARVEALAGTVNASVSDNVVTGVPPASTRA